MKQNFYYFYFNTNLDSILYCLNNELLYFPDFFFDDLYFDEKDSYYKNIKQNIKQNINLENLEKVLEVKEKINYDSYDFLEVQTTKENISENKDFPKEISKVSYNLEIKISPKNKTITFIYNPSHYTSSKEIENLDLFLKVKITLVLRSKKLEIKIHRASL